MQKNISIVIPNWNGEEKLRRHLPFVIKAAKHSKVSEIIIVDDGSTDKSIEVIKKEFPEINLIIKEKNTGFSSTVNIGVAAASGEFVVLINNDASPSEDFLDSLLPHFEDPKVFSVGCNVGGVWNKAEFRNGFFWHSQATPEEAGLKKNAHLTMWASGGSGIFRKKLWEEIGGLDESFDPFYEEDVDLGYRALKRGYLNLWEPKSLVEHYKEKGVIELHFKKEKVAQTAQRNQLLFIWKNITDKTFISDHIKALIKMAILHPGYLKIIFAALKKLPQILRKREIEKKAAKLTDKEVLNIVYQGVNL